MKWLLDALGAVFVRFFGTLGVKAGFTSAYVVGVGALVATFVSLQQAMKTGLSVLGPASISSEYGFSSWSQYVWMFVPNNLTACISAIGSAMVAKWAFNMALGRLDVAAQVPGR